MENNKDLKKHNDIKAPSPSSAENGAGGYDGAVYESACPHGQYHTAMVFLWSCITLSLALQIACACISVQLTGKVLYVIIPCAAAILTCAVILYLTARLTLGGKSLSEKVYKSTVGTIPALTLVGAVVFAAAFCSEVLSLILNGFGEAAWASVLFLALQLIGAVSLLAARLAVAGLPWKRAD